MNVTTEHALSHLADVWLVTVQLYAVTTMFVVFKFHDTEALESKNITESPVPATVLCLLSYYVYLHFMRLIPGFLRLPSENISIGYVMASFIAIWRKSFRPIKLILFFSLIKQKKTFPFEFE